MREGNSFRAQVSAVAVVVLLLLAACTSSDDAVESNTGSSTTSAPDSSASLPSDSATTETGSEASGSPESVASTAGPTSTGPTSTEPPTEVTSEAEPIATTDVPAPGGGDINQTVASVAVMSLPAVELNQEADFGDGVIVSLVSVDNVQTVAEGPGEVSGPGLAVTVKIANGSASPVSLATVNVTLSDAVQTPGAPMSASPASPFSGELAAGQEAQGVYVYTLPADYTDPATITVSYSASVPVAVFVGNAK